MISIKLTDSIARYKNESENKKKKRALWNESVKQLLIDTISQIVSKHAIGWSMELMGSSTNVEGVTLTFGDIIIGVEPTINEPISENTAVNAENVEVKYYTKTKFEKKLLLTKTIVEFSSLSFENILDLFEFILI